MEGPFIDVEKKGAQKEAHILAPDISFLKTCNALCKLQIKLVTLSPKAPNALSFIKELHQEVTISLGHTSADYEISKEAFAAATIHPAKSIGIFDSVGSLDVGKKAALLLADKQFHLLQVIS